MTKAKSLVQFLTNGLVGVMRSTAPRPQKKKTET